MRDRKSKPRQVIDPGYIREATFDAAHKRSQQRQQEAAYGPEAPPLTSTPRKRRTKRTITPGGLL